MKVSLRQLSPTEAIILHISPKFATVHDHVSFQWTLKMQGTANLDDEEEEECAPDLRGKQDYVAVSLYYVDGPVSSLELRAKLRIIGEKKNGDEENVVDEKKIVTVARGRECELTDFDKDTDRGKLSDYIKAHLGQVIRLSVILEMNPSLFKADAYLNAVSPTPIHSFLTANYRARACSKVWKKRSRLSLKRPRSNSEGGPNLKKVDLEKKFNRVMDDERERRAAQQEGSAEDEANTAQTLEHLFKRLLVECCDSCERRASLCPAVEETDEAAGDADEEDEGVEEEENHCFECPEEDKAEMHDMLANMYFNKVALPEMEYVEDFADFLIDAELSDLPVLKRAAERYLCGELNTKKDLMTSLLLDLLFLAMVFQLPVMKSMTLTELCDRHAELEDVDKLLEKEEYKNLDKRIRQISDRNLHDLIDECRRFREQRLRVQSVP